MKCSDRSIRAAPLSATRGLSWHSFANWGSCLGRRYGHERYGQDYGNYLLHNSPPNSLHNL